jgi:hypothetical protein
MASPVTTAEDPLREALITKLPPELYYDEEELSKVVTKAHDMMPLAMRKNPSCKCADEGCPHKAAISPLFLFLFSEQVGNCIRYRGDFSKTFNPGNFPIHDFVKPACGLSFSTDMTVFLLEKKIPDFYQRIRVHHPESRNYFSVLTSSDEGWSNKKWDQLEVTKVVKDGKTEVLVMMVPMRCSQILEGLEFTGSCRPSRVMLSLSDTEAELPAGGSTLRNGFYLPYGAMAYTNIQFKLFFSEDKPFEATNFRFNVIIGFIPHFDLKKVPEFNLPMLNGYMIVMGGVGDVIAPTPPSPKQRISNERNSNDSSQQ